jgi:hypothetical protein
MREGAWIRMRDGEFWWIDEHADWMKRAENAREVGLSETVYQSIAAIPNDYSGPRRETILRAVMADGFIRMRGRGDVLVFEFSASWRPALLACRNVLRAIGGEFLVCRFHNLLAQEWLEMVYRDYAAAIEADLEAILARRRKI